MTYRAHGTGSLQQIGRGVWRSQLVAPDGRRLSRTHHVGTKKDAQAAHDRFRALVAIEALSTNVLRLTEGRQMDADTIDYLRGQVERLDDLVAAMYERSQAKDTLVADLTRRMNLAVNLGRMVKEQSDRWQEMAEDLWEELQEWHQVDCPCWSDKNDTIKPSCICHRILEAKWNECTNASDWVEDEWDQAAAP